MIGSNNPRFVIIGGGTGSFTLLSSLRGHVKDLTALVNMSDDGGSTGVLRDELGVLPPGDVRQCLVALSNSPRVRQLFNYRFETGTLSGHSFGNLFISAVEKMTNSFEEAVDLAGEILNIQGKVIPITTDKVQLVLKQLDGEIVKDQFKICHLDFAGQRRPDIYLEPSAAITESGRQAIAEADIVVIAPGNLYGSLAPVLVVDGIKQALEEASAKVVYICNLVTKPNQTDGFMVHDYADEVERFIGSKVLDYVVYNTDEPPEELVDRYLHDGEKMVGFDIESMATKHYRSIGLPLIAKEPAAINRADKIAHARSLIRHDQSLIARQLMSLYYSF